eukprot:10236-Heterococcus_DN1.PRE.2
MQQQFCSHCAVLASSGQVASAGTANSAANLHVPPTDNDTDMSDGDSVSISKYFEQQGSMSDVRSYSAAQQRATVPKAMAINEARPVAEPVFKSKPVIGPFIEPKATSDSESDGGNSAYSDDSCDENDMMTNVEQVTGFYSRATDRLHRRILHRIKKYNSAAELKLQSARMQELRGLLDRARVLSFTMKTKQYKLIVIGKGYGKTDVVNTLCGGMKAAEVRIAVVLNDAACSCARKIYHSAAAAGVVPNSHYKTETAINIPVQLTSNKSTRAKPHYTVEFCMYADTATRFANCNVVEQQQVEWQRGFEAQLQQNAEWIGELPFRGQGQFQLEQDVTGRIQEFCAAAAVVDAVTGCSYEGAVEYIAVTGPFDIPLDFTVIEMPSLDTMPEYRKQSISTMATSGSAVVYTTVQRPTTADMCAFVQPDTSVYSVNKAMPIAVGYFSDAVITANARGATAAGNFTAIGRTTAAAAAALHAASIVDNEDTHLVQQAMYTAVEQVVTINSESERSALAACIDNIVLFDRTVLVQDRKVCHKLFCARANGFSAKQTLLNGTKAATRDEVHHSIQQLLSLRGIDDSSSGAGVSQEFEKMLYKAVEASSADAVTAAVQWADIAYELTLKDFAKQVACTLRQAFATSAAAAANPQANVKAGGNSNSNSSNNDSLSMYLQACARDQCDALLQSESIRAQSDKFDLHISHLISQATDACHNAATSVQDNVEGCVRIMEQNSATMMNTLAQKCCTAAALLIDEQTLVIKKNDTWALYTLQHDLYTVGKVSAYTDCIQGYTCILTGGHCYNHYMSACATELSHVADIRAMSIAACAYRLLTFICWHF